MTGTTEQSSSETSVASGADNEFSLRIRRIRPTDRAALERMHDRCSLNTRFNRWFNTPRVVPRGYLEAILGGSPDQIALVAEIADEPGEVVGLASAARRGQQQHALGLVVEDRYQAQGIGRRLIDQLISVLPAQEDLCADTWSENRPLLTKLAAYGSVAIIEEGGTIHAKVSRRDCSAPDH